MIKVINKTSATLLHGLYHNGLEFFDIKAAAQILNDRKDVSLRRVLSDMVKNGLLMRLQDGFYTIIPYHNEPETYFPNWHIVAHHLAGETPYYIGYYSALALYDLTVQPSLREQIVVAKPIRPTTHFVKDILFQFITHNEPHFFGVSKKWVEDGTFRIHCSDLEKTLIDCAFKPDYAGGVSQLSHALYKSRAVLNPEKMLDYTQRFGSDAVVRRLGFLLEALDILPELARALNEQTPKPTSYVALETALPKKGQMYSRWGIVQNIDLSTIQSVNFT
ncbi:MAG: transcriptional regulator [Saprospiraceae bacterium]|nr:transcriptional regulator [Saprospiraceae bacterium]